MKKRSAGLILSLVLLLTVLAACSSNSTNNNNSTNNAGSSAPSETNTPSQAEETVTIKYVVPGTEPPSWPQVKEAVDKKLQEDGVNVRIDMQYIDWSVWDQKINLMLSTEEDFDMFQVMNNVVSLSNYIARGAVKDISKEMDEYGPDIRKTIPEGVLNAVTKDGALYGVPSYWYEPAYDNVFTTNDYLLKKAGIDTVPQTPQELLDAAVKVYEGAAAPKPEIPISVSDFMNVGALFLHSSFDAFPFDVRDGVAMITEDGKVNSWIESDEFKAESAFFREAYQKKLINPDILTLKQDQVLKAVTEMNWPFIPGTSSNTPDKLDKYLPGSTLEDITAHQFNEDKGYYRFANAKNLNVVVQHSDKAAAAVKFLNWLYANQDNYDLFMYGIEGVTYKKTGEKGMEAILDAKTQAPLIPNADWMIGNLNYIRVSDMTASGKILYQKNESAKDFLASGFFFDSSTVKTELGNVKAVITSDVAPIYVGVVDYDSHIKQAAAKLKTAGLDKVLAEYQKQLDAYLGK